MMEIDPKAHQFFCATLCEHLFENEDAISLEHARRGFADWMEWAPKCGSPIEQYMLTALMFCSFGYLDGPHRVTDDQAGQIEKEWTAWITPQFDFAPYRLDFLLTVAGFGGDGGCVVIECDGHYFHERTKEQARRDKSRDRHMQTLGFPVFRYTGSEIWKDPRGIVEDIDGYFSLILRESLRKHKGIC